MLMPCLAELDLVIYNTTCNTFEGREGGAGKEEETPQVKTQRGPELPTDVPDYATEAI